MNGWNIKKNMKVKLKENGGLSRIKMDKCTTVVSILGMENVNFPWV